MPLYYSEANSAEYVTDSAVRDALLAKGCRDDGIAFYTAKNRNQNRVPRALRAGRGLARRWKKRG